jgi:hypothetical protein
VLTYIKTDGTAIAVDLSAKQNGKAMRFNQQHYDSAQSRCQDGLPPIHSFRKDGHMETLVNEAIRMQSQSGSKAASQFMATHEIPITVALRVILQPHLRRTM